LCELDVKYHKGFEVMSTLDWIGRDTVVNHHNEVLFHLLRCNPELSVGEVWEKASAGGCLFVMPKGPDFGLIRAKIG
jgi:hypothetical protein